MKTNELVKQSFRIAKERYAAIGVDVDQAIIKLESMPVSLHCWQADDVIGFENLGNVGGSGIQATGNHPGKARNIDEVRQDLEKALTYIAGKHRVNLQAIYGDFKGKELGRDEFAPEHFISWMQWAKEKGLKLDFNSSSFGHPMSGDLTLANPDKVIRDYWIRHTKQSRLISDEIGKYQKDPSIMNIWVHDGMKDLTANRYYYRQILEQSLDEIYSIEYKNIKDCIEAKLFGLGLESYTVGSYDFYLGYGVRHNKMLTLDTGHYHLTESVADKIPSLLLFTPGVMLHVSRPVRWDSDHVTILDDDTVNLAKEIVRADALDRVYVGLDFFDASINRVGAYVIGARAIQKAFMQALLEPLVKIREYEKNGQYFARLALLEEAKVLPWNAVWDYFCLKNNVPVGEDYIEDIHRYERKITFKR
jgi:L-rhamnose isomerase